jgi:ribosomal-protein-alanine acetyltransferase
MTLLGIKQMEVKIEDATLEHLDNLFEIEQQCFTKEAFTKQQISYLLTDYNTISLVAKINKEVAGFIIMQLESEDETVFGHIITLNVSTKYRRKGVAQAMIHETEDILKSRGIHESRLEVRQDNTAAKKLYQCLGYREIGKLDHYYGQKHGLYLKKNL